MHSCRHKNSPWEREGERRLALQFSWLVSVPQLSIAWGILGCPKEKLSCLLHLSAARLTDPRSCLAFPGCLLALLQLSVGALFGLQQVIANFHPLRCQPAGWHLSCLISHPSRAFLFGTGPELLIVSGTHPTVPMFFVRTVAPSKV